MIKLKKTILVAALLAFSAAAFAQEVSFENTLSSDIVEITVADDETDSSFAGLENNTVVGYTSDKLDFGLDISFFLTTAEVVTGLNKTSAYMAIGQGYGLAGYAINDYFVEFRPIELLGIGFHQGYSIAGSYLPVEDSNLDAGNIGSDFGLFIRPIEGLTIGAGLDFTSLFGGYDDWDSPYLNFGAEYEIADTVSFGAAFRDILNDSRSIGAYVSFFALEGLTINGGFTYNGEFADVAGNLVSAGVIFEKDAISLAGDLVLALGGDEDDGFDFYAGAAFGYQISDPFSVSIAASFKSDFDADEDGWELGINPGVAYAINDHHEVGAGLSLTFTGTETCIAIPVYWTYSF
ncbi:hypothetical protein [Treponema sp.]|uniref:hypothetical protein n=1 Tax=Treponema sp. TaxID=166 RepID=UPI0025D14AB5|nr:hypothetical protein [Treponema sp.]MCR5217290.1 hypothetical protein [Treponema sp.]